MSGKKPKLFIILPDGVSLRNFAYSNFYKMGIDKGFEIWFWNNTPFDLDALGFNQLNFTKPKLHWLTSIFKTARLHIELSVFEKRYHDAIYKSYLFPLSYKGFKNKIKNLIVLLLVSLFNSETGLSKIRRIINVLEVRTSYFKHCKAVLEEHQPDFVFCTSQRNVLAIAPLLAAKKLNIPTMSFVYSWDNLPKATLDVSSDFYAVWSEYMRDEILYYHPFLNSSQIKVTGTPQFESHYDKSIISSKTEFYKTYNLDEGKRYVCYSGDDITTSPKDPLYLRDVAQAIRQLNANGHQIGVLFRRCPVDISNRYDEVIETFKDVIVPVQPIWKKINEGWDTILPLPEDLILLSNIVAHTEVVINLGSSMVFDFVAHQKPCFYMNYNYLNTNNKLQEGVYVYDYVHFRSKPNDDVVIWIHHPDEIGQQIINSLRENKATINAANAWYQKINEHPPQMASARIWKCIMDILNNS